MSEYLTQEQVDSLKTGEKVEILWSGGSGPFVYVIINKDKCSYTKDSNGNLAHRIDFVGNKKPFTLVKIP